MAVTCFYGSEGWGFESLRARAHLRARPGQRPLPVAEGAWPLTPILGQPGSAHLAELMLISATRGAPHIVFRTYDAPATRTSLPAAVQLVAFEIRVGTQEMFLGILDIVSCLDARQRKVSTFGRAVRTWRLLVSHCRPASFCRNRGGLRLIQAMQPNPALMASMTRGGPHYLTRQGWVAAPPDTHGRHQRVWTRPDLGGRSGCSRPAQRRCWTTGRGFARDHGTRSQVDLANTDANNGSG